MAGTARVDSPGFALGVAAVILSILAAAALAATVPYITGGGTLRFVYPWAPSLGISVSFYLDGLSLLFGLLITGVGALVALYATAYMRGNPQFSRFFLYLMVFQVSMFGLVMAEDLILIYVFWELTTISSFLLIGFNHDKEEALRNAWQSLLVTAAGGLALLAGLILLASVAGTWLTTELVDAGDIVRTSPLYLPILILILLGAFTKSAQFPFHFWLPRAMVAPTPVSAYLHSATMVKAGIYLLARLYPDLSGTPEWTWILTLTGAFTAVWGSVLALRQSDLKTALAYSTVMALGAIVMFLGSEQTIAIAAALTFLVVHALYKSALFLCIGVIDHGTGTRSMDRLGGLARVMPFTAIASCAAAFSMAGFPPFLGFIGKELKYEGALAVAAAPTLVVMAAILANALMVAVAGMVAVRPFFGEPRETPIMPPREPPRRMWIAPFILALFGLILGLAPPYVELLVQPAVAAVIGAPVIIEFALWHGINVPLLLSVITVTIGLIVYRYRLPVRRVLQAAPVIRVFTGDRTYDAIKDSILWLAAVQTAVLQNGSLRRYLFVVFAVTAGSVGGTLVAKESLVLPAVWPAAAVYEWAAVVLVAAGAGLVVFTRSRLSAICGLSASGVGIALIFLLFSAPDVALAQLIVEILFVVMIATLLPKLLKGRDAGWKHRKRGIRIWNGIVAVSVGVVVAGLLLAVQDAPFSRHIMDYYAAMSVPMAHGHNIVNVILVDFRALDTLGEIIVLAVAGLGVVALITHHARQKSEP
jgi:multicomponent Na+:H+ antiporter subunit A